MIPGLIGILESLEALKLCLNIENVLCSEMLILDGELCKFKKFKLR